MLHLFSTYHLDSTIFFSLNSIFHYPSIPSYPPHEFIYFTRSLFTTGPLPLNPYLTLHIPSTPTLPSTSPLPLPYPPHPRCPYLTTSIPQHENEMTSVAFTRKQRRSRLKDLDARCDRDVRAIRRSIAICTVLVDKLDVSRLSERGTLRAAIPRYSDRFLLVQDMSSISWSSHTSIPPPTCAHDPAPLSNSKQFRLSQNVKH